jgi:O-antigen/teichoic acid export membrane protein
MRSALGRLAGFLRGSSSAAAVTHIALTNGLMLGMNVLAGILTARALRPDGRGQLAAILLWPQLVGYACAFSMAPAFLYYASKEPENRRFVTGGALAVSALGGLLGMLVGMCAMPVLLSTAAPQTLQFARYMMVFSPLAAVGTVLIAALQQQGKFRLYNRFRYLPVAATLLGLLSLLLLGRMTPRTAALAYLLPGIPVFAVLGWWVRRQFNPSLRHAAQVSPRLLGYGARAYGGEVAGTLVAQLDKVLLVNLLTASHFGIYVVVFNLSRMLTTFSSAVAPVLLPRTAGKAGPEVLAMTNRALTSTMPILFACAAAFVVAGGAVLRFWYGADFAAGYAGLCILVVEAVVGSVAYITMQPFFALNRPGVVTIINALSLPVMALALLVLVPRFGLNGAAMGVLVSTAFRAAATYAAFGWVLRAPGPRLWPELRASLELLRRLRASGSQS